MLPDKGTAAFGRPGIAPSWTQSRKEGIVTAYHTSSRVWATLSEGIVNEVYFPTVDSPQTRDLQYLVTDGESFFHEEKRDLEHAIECIDAHALGYRLVNSDPQGRYRIVKEVIAAPHLSCVLVRTRLEGEDSLLRKLRLFVLWAPHIGGRGWGNNAVKARVGGRDLLVAYKGDLHAALGATLPFTRSSCGYVGASDGWTDLHDNLKMDWEFDAALDGNVALTGEIDLAKHKEFTLGLSFGFGLHNASNALLQSLAPPYRAEKRRFEEQWRRTSQDRADLEKASGDRGRLYHASRGLILAHEDKSYPGAMIAALSIPWGESLGDEDGLGGYHLVWTRDLCQSASALLAAGNLETPRRSLIFLAASQLPDGGFYQNFWINGRPYWRGVQLDEASFPILLAWRLHELGGLGDFDPYPMVARAAHFLIHEGPATAQERWEENSGYSPSTLACNVAALVCAAQFARLRKHPNTADYLEDYADFLEARIDAWTTTTQGSLVPGVPRHYIRIHPVDPRDPQPREDPNAGILDIRNRPPGEPFRFPAKDIVDAGFLELVRYGIRKPGAALIEDSLQVVDEILKIDTPFGPCWRRYNHDGYGQRSDGSPYLGWGQGRAWPLLTGERGHYELAAGRSARPFIKAMEGFAARGRMLPEQIWDEPAMPGSRMRPGCPTDSAMPLLWAHAEYIRLLRSARDEAVFDRIDAVARRYSSGKARKKLEIWKFRRQPRRVPAGGTLRIQRPSPFLLHWTQDEWRRSRDSESVATEVGIHYVDIPIGKDQKAPIRFTFYWTEEGRWEGRDFRVECGR